MFLPGCEFPEQHPAPDVVIGNIGISRAPRDPQQYALTIEVLNRSSHQLQRLTFRARVSTSVDHETELTAPLAIEVPVVIGAGVRVSVTAILETPFAVVPPGPLVLEEIRVGTFVFQGDGAGDATYEAPGWIRYPWSVEEKE